MAAAVTWQEEFADVTPVPQDDGPAPLVVIQYDDEFRQLMDVFRAVVKAGEVSERALRLTSQVVDSNAANYTAWQYRRELLQKLGSDLGGELTWLADVCLENPKNYQVWYHRMQVVTWAKRGIEDELALTKAVLEEDSKNYHAWAHRQWAIAHYAAWDGELDFASDLLLRDVRNNSAWNHRRFVIDHCGAPITAEVVERELKLVEESVSKTPNNESPYSYARSFLTEDTAPRIAAMCTKVLGIAPPCTYARILLADSLIRDRVVTDTDAKTKAKALFTELIKLDPIRTRYWQHRCAQL